MRAATRMFAALSVLAICASGCATKASSSQDAGASGDVKTDVGVTDDTITLGVMTDLTSVFKPSGVAYSAGHELWAKDVNEAGGICGRDVELDIRDHGYKPDNAFALYPQMLEQDLAIMDLLGSPILAALKPRIAADKFLTIAAAWASENLDTEAVLILGQTYDIEMLNGLNFLAEEGMIAKGDKIGHIYVDSEYGLNANKGVKSYADQTGMTVVDAAVSATDSDMTATIAKLKSEGVSAIAVTTAPVASGSVLLQNTAQGLDVPILGSSPTFSIQLLSDQGVVDAMQNFDIVGNADAFGTGTGNEVAAKVSEEYAATYSDPPDRGVMAGYVFGMAMQAILEQACSNGDLTRDGLLKARKQLDDIDTKGITGNLDFSDPGAPTSREGFIFTIDPNAEVGIVVTRELYASDEAKAYKAPHEK